MSARKEDSNGYIEIRGNPLTKVGVFPYLGKSIGAPNPDQIYYVLRPAEELEKQEAIDSFKLVPLIDEHEMLGNFGTAAEEKGVQGTIGEDVYFEYPYLRGSLKIFSESVKNSIRNGKIELSAGYACRWDFTEGEFEGEHFDVIQRDIRANHLALVAQGRCGSDVAVMDSMTFAIDEKEVFGMKEEEKEAKACDSMTLEEAAKLLGEIVPQIQALTSFMDKLKPIEEQEHGVNLDEDEDNKEFAEGVEYGEEKEKEEPKKLDEEHESEGMKKAMDSAEIIREIGKRNALASKLSEHIGTFACDSMTLNEVAVYGCKKLGLSAPKGTESVALEFFLKDRKVAKPVAKSAMDSAETPSNDLSKYFA